MIRSRTKIFSARTFVVLGLALALASGCAAARTTELSGPALLPGTVPGADDAAVISADAVADDEAAEIAPAEGFALDLSGAVGVEPAQDPAGPGATPAGPGQGDAPIAPSDLAFVQKSIDEVSSGSYRYTVTLAMSIVGGGQNISIAPSAPLVVGEASATQQRSLTDLNVLFEAMWAEIPDADVAGLRDLFGGDLTIETIIDGTDLYLRAPFLARAGGLGGPGIPPAIASLGDGWGQVDLTQVPGLSSDEIAALTGTQSGSGPDEILAMLGTLDDKVVDLGPTSLGGVDTTHYRTMVDIEAALAAGAVDAGSLGAEIGDAEAVFGDGFAVDVYVDADGHVRRISMAFSAEGLPDGGSFEMSTAIDFSDHGADISITVPSDGVDLTSSFVALFGGI